LSINISYFLYYW